MFEISTLLLLAWGALAFGAEYAWAFAPLLVFAVVPAIFGLRAKGAAAPSRILMLTLGLVFLAGTLQWVVPARLVPTAWQSPPSVNFGQLYALATMQPVPAATGTISIAPARTMLGLTFLAVLSALLFGCTRGVSAFGPRRLVHGIVILGSVVAFVGLIQAAAKTDTIYGFWHQPKVSVPFAPFVNKNHFAGWIAMVMSLAIGSLSGGVAIALKGVNPGWRNRLLWFSSQRASSMLFTTFAVTVMAVSMVIATSRGGLIGLVVIFAIFLWLMLRRQVAWRRVIGGAGLLLIIVLATSWGGVGKTLERFNDAVATMGDRKDIWADTVRIIQDYPVTGTGLNTFAIAMLHYQGDYAPGVAMIEAHNDYLQLAAEGGLLLGIPILLALGALIWQIHRRFAEGRDDAETYWLRAGAVTGLCAIAVMEITDFTLQMAGAAVMFVVLASIAIHRPNDVPPKATGGRREARQ